jgi:hypothetical protein
MVSLVLGSEQIQGLLALVFQKRTLRQDQIGVNGRVQASVFTRSANRLGAISA